MPSHCSVLMSQNSPSQTILRQLRFSGMVPHEYIPVDHVADFLITGGMSLDDLEAGLAEAVANDWLEMEDDSVGLTEAGYQATAPANDNKGLHLVT